ncbi:MAG TPA: pitrilysin family protein [Thermoplasmata archaeon]|nr:pitrilysin family protein [Thermoplasmata archaeon]
MSSSADPLRLEYGTPANGLSVVRQPPPAGAASFSATYVGPAGWGFDPKGREGTARIANYLLSSGAGPFDRVALARCLDRAGASLTTECAPESAEVTIWGPASDWRRLLGLLADVVLRPRFATEDLERVQRQMTERQLRESSQPASRADRELFHATYPTGHPYRTFGLGNARSVGRVTPDRLREFHRTHYASGDAILVVTTFASLRTVESTARSCFSSLPERPGPTLPMPPVRAHASRRFDVNLKGRSQVEIRVGGNSIPRSDPLYPAAFLANEVLGGRAQLSRLFQRVREQGGLVYHASSELESMRFGGYWSVGAGTGPDRYEKVLELLRHEIREVSVRLLPPTELKEVRESSIGEIPLALETTAEAHELAVETAYHRLPPDFLLRWPSLLRSVTPEEVQLAARRAMDGRTATTVLAGPLSEG